MVLVRKSELACRNGWDQDLWEQGADTSPSSVVPSSDQFSRPTSMGPAFSPDMIPDPSSADGSAGEIFTDKIQSIGLSLRPADPASPVAQGPVAHFEPESTVQDSRSAVREARRRRQEQRSEDQRRHKKALAAAAGAMLDQPTPPEPDAPVKPSTPPQPVERPATSIRVPVRANRDSSHNLDVPAARKLQRPAERDTDEWIDVKGTPERFDEMKALQSDGSRDRRALDGGTEPLPVKQLREGMAGDTVDPDVVRVEPSSPTPPFIDPPIPHRETTWITGAGAIGTPRRSVAHDVVSDGMAREPRLPLAMPRDPIDGSEFASSVPRCCATCRDFKRVGDGTRGWCVNPHAFTERRMVESDDLSCRSSIGTWWLPSDDLWLERVDMTHHGRPTPLLDQLHGDDLIEGYEMESRPY